MAEFGERGWSDAVVLDVLGLDHVCAVSAGGFGFTARCSGGGAVVVASLGVILRNPLVELVASAGIR